VLRYRDDVPFVVGTTYCSPELAGRLAAQDLSEIDVLAALEERCGVRIARTSVIVEARLADVRLARRLQCEPGAAMLRIRTNSHDHDDEPCIYGVTDCRADMMDYRVTLRS
jgi:GntR family transcriptional regulator